MSLTGAIAMLDDAISRYVGLTLLLTWIAGGAILVWLRREQRREHDQLSQTLHTLRYEIDEGRQMFQVPEAVSPAVRNGTTGVRISRAQYETELEAYRDIWRVINELHRTLGVFLRSIETRERSAEYRQQTRSAATEAKDLTALLMPFYHEAVEQIVTQMLDRYIYLHLSACSFLDEQAGERLDSLPLQQGVTLDVLRERTRTLYEGEAKQQLKDLARAIRRRITDVSVME